MTREEAARHGRVSVDGFTANRTPFRVAEPREVPVSRPTRPFSDIMAPQPTEVVEVASTETHGEFDSFTGHEHYSYDVDEMAVKIAEVESENGLYPVTPVNTELTSTIKEDIVISDKKGLPVGHLVKTTKNKISRFALPALAVVILGATTYVSIDTWMTNSAVRQVATSQADRPEDVQGAVTTEGGDETEVKPSAIDSYKVAADAPRVLTIDKVGVRARILPMGINTDGAIQAPVNIYDSGWYTGSAKPGTPGAAFIDAHASGATREGLFAYLDKLAVGDTLSVEKGDGEKLTYRVVKTEVEALDAIDMSKVLKPADGVTEGLNLMTCTGVWVKDKNTYDKRVIVYTERV